MSQKTNILIRKSENISRFGIFSENLGDLAILCLKSFGA